MTFDLSYKQRNRQTDIITFTNTSLGTQLNMGKKILSRSLTQITKIRIIEPLAKNIKFPNTTRGTLFKELKYYFFIYTNI